MSFLRGIVSEPGGQGSSTRTCFVVLMLALTACIVRVVIVKGEFPSFPPTFVELVTWLVSAMLFGNVLKNGIGAWQNVKGGGDAATPDAGSQP